MGYDKGNRRKRGNHAGRYDRGTGRPRYPNVSKGQGLGTPAVSAPPDSASQKAARSTPTSDQPVSRERSNQQRRAPHGKAAVKSGKGKLLITWKEGDLHFNKEQRTLQLTTGIARNPGVRWLMIGAGILGVFLLISAVANGRLGIVPFIIGFLVVRQFIKKSRELHEKSEDKGPFRPWESLLKMLQVQQTVFDLQQNQVRLPQGQPLQLERAFVHTEPVLKQSKYRLTLNVNGQRVALSESNDRAALERAASIIAAHTRINQVSKA